MKKLVISSLIALIGISPVLNAQDDVSIMDLKETVYLLLKDVEQMKVKEEKFKKTANEIVNRNGNIAAENKSDLKDLRSEVNMDRQKEVLPNYRVSSKLINFASKQ